MSRSNKSKQIENRIIDIDPLSIPFSSNTYIWQVYVEKSRRYFECTDEYLYKPDNKSNPDWPDLVMLTLSNITDSNQVDFYDEYFNEAFNMAGLGYSRNAFHEYSRIVLPKSVLESFQKLFKEPRLFDHRDFFLRIIILAQLGVTRTSVNQNLPSTQNQIISSESDIKKLIEVIDNTLLDFHQPPHELEDKRTNLEYIKFAFQKSEPISIKNEWLREELIRIIRDHFDGQKYKHWRKDLLDITKKFGDQSNSLKFEKLLARSYYNFLYEEKLMVSTKPFESKLMLFISDLLKFSFINSIESKVSESDRANNVRTWLNPGRNEIIPLAKLEEEPDFQLLKEYFDSTFVDLGDKKFYQDSMKVAKYISDRFEINELIPELTHIGSAIRATNNIIGYQLSSTSSNDIPLPEFQSLRKLLIGLKAGKKLTSVSLTMDTPEGSKELNHRMPLFLFEEALKEYYEKNSVEFESNIVVTSIFKETEFNVNVLSQDHFNLPHQRFFVRLIHQLITFLQDYADIDSSRSRIWFLQIIAILYRDNGVFYHQNEDILVDKLEKWYFLNCES